MGCCLICSKCTESITKDIVKEKEFLERILETKVSEHVKDIEDLQGVIQSQREEISRLKEMLYP